MFCVKSSEHSHDELTAISGHATETNHSKKKMWLGAEAFFDVRSRGPLAIKCIWRRCMALEEQETEVRACQSSGSLGTACVAEGVIAVFSSFV